jgi:hypothetical protein
MEPVRGEKQGLYFWISFSFPEELLPYQLSYWRLAWFRRKDDTIIESTQLFAEDSRVNSLSTSVDSVKNDKETLSGGGQSSDT